MALGRDRNDLARFFNKTQFSDVIIKYGESKLYAHKTVLAGRSAYFARAFLGQFPVASSSTIDLGSEDDPEMIHEMIRSMYVRDDALSYTVFPRDDRSLATLVDMFILADKYDVPHLRRKTSYAFEAKLSHDYSRNEDEFIRTIISRICRPKAVQFADKDLQRSTLEHCKLQFADLLQDERFIEQYIQGTLLDSEFALAFNPHVGQSALKSKGLDTTLTKGYEKKSDRSPTSTLPDFFNSQLLSNVIITYGCGQTIFAHKIVLTASPSPSYFLRILKASPSIDYIALNSKDEPKLIEALIHDLYDLSYDPDPEDLVTFWADMYLLAEKYGLNDISDIYLVAVLNEVTEDMTSSQYALHVTRFCGPSAAACYTDTELSERIFNSTLHEPHLLLDENETFCKSLENGTLFDSKFSGRFAMKVMEMYRDAEKASL